MLSCHAEANNTHTAHTTHARAHTPTHTHTLSLSLAFSCCCCYRELQATAPAVEQRLLAAMVPRDDADDGSAIVEIRAGTGGTEATLFAKDLYKLYNLLAQQRGWKVQELTSSAADGIGSDNGYKEVTFSINGTDAFGTLKFESGVHRVQRVPVTEAAGRIHTSTATVAVLPQATDVNVSVHERDIKMDTYRSGGAGGQHVNTTDSAVRLTHVPTGIVVAVQSERSQHRNRDVAMKMLRAKVYQQERERAEEQRIQQRRDLIGDTPGSRSERIRTYNYPQDRVTGVCVSFSRRVVEMRESCKVMEG